MALHKPLKQELDELRKKKRDLAKREKQIKAEQKLEKDIEKWQRIMDVKSACEKLIKDADIGMKMNLKKLDSFPDYYIYQHPVNKKLKTADRNALWVKQYLDETPMDERGGMQGVEADLIATARKTRLSAWKRAVNKKTRKQRVAAGGNAGGKAKAVGSVGVG